jgi:hypothetical protein
VPFKKSSIAVLLPKYQSFIETRQTYAFIAFSLSVNTGLAGAIFMMMRPRQDMALFSASGLPAFAATIPTPNADILSSVLCSSMSIILAVI